MVEALLDPWMLAFKDGNSCAENYLQDLLDLHDAVIADGVVCEVTASASTLLEEDGLFPLSADALMNSWMKKGDVFKIVGALLDKLPKIEDRHVMPLMVDEYRSTPLMGNVLSVAHECHVQELIASSLILREISETNLAVLSRTYPLGDVHSRLQVIEVDGASRCGARLGWHEGSSRIAQKPDDLRIKRAADQIALDGEVVLAISVTIAERGGAGEWSVGPDFIRSLQKENFFANPSRMRALLRTAADVVLRADERSTHAIRTAKGGGSKQVARGDKLAWRVDIDDEYHIHYWSSGATFEFVKVVTHNDFTI